MVWVADGETGKGELGRREKKMKSIGEGGDWKRWNENMIRGWMEMYLRPKIGVCVNAILLDLIF